MDEWDHSRPDAYHEASPLTRVTRAIPFLHGSAFIHLQCQFAMMELMLDLFTTLAGDFSSTPLAWNGTFTVNVVDRIREHMNMYLSQYKRNRLSPFSRNFSKDLQLTTVTEVGAAVGVMITSASAYVYREAQFDPLGAAMSVVKSIVKVGQWLGEKISQKNIAMEDILQVSREWETAEKVYGDDDAFVYNSNDRPNGLRAVVPEIAMHVAISELLPNSMQLAPYLIGKVGGAEDSTSPTKPGGTAGMASATDTKGV